MTKRKKKAHRKIILKIELGVIILATVIAVTVAWFVRKNLAQVKDTNLKISSAEYIRIALKAGGNDVLELTGEEAFVKINMPEFFDTEADKLAPGVYGHMDLYITALSPLTDKCSLTIDFVPGYME